MTTPPPEVIAAYGLERATFEPIDIGLINRTFRVDIDGAPCMVLQRQHHTFRGEVNLDIEAITAHLASRGIGVPRLVRTRDGRPFVEHDGLAWRALTHIRGATVARIEDPALAHAAARLVGRFHRAIDRFEHSFAFTRPGAHDTTAHLARLSGAMQGEHPIRAIAEEILAHPLPSLPSLPIRIIHGDLKITNVLFDASLTDAIALLDLDTFQHATIAIELGDALRSWCNTRGESGDAVQVDVAIFEAAVRGYAETSGDLLNQNERESIALGLETIALELSSRFALDAVEDRYFAWDANRYPSRVAHNIVRARSQLALARSARSLRRDLQETVRRAFAQR